MDGLIWPVPSHPFVSQAFGVTTVPAELRSYEHNGFLVTDHDGPKVFRLLRNGRIPGGVFASLVHPAVDIPAPWGTLVVAAHHGTIVGQGVDPVTGEHWQTLRLPSGVELFGTHYSAFLVPLGYVAAQGEPIARIGSTGNSFGPHEHFEVRTPTGAGPELDYPADRVNPRRCMRGQDLASFIETGKLP